ncbi:N-acetyl sugar amidotransferase [Hyphomicrobium sp.]|uniref:N-acetyl sugar amidotransferase n=1 Tax=Hyphomicrobium sp. TaxID=82 RepID=UPI0025B9E15D|nr:N-acetyl sugar amidotransferase [Hyphomicrobium sp.]MCC7250961.1 N-acetyl sugar amidotransferase [Hyphomicrobium sp.]
MKSCSRCVMPETAETLGFNDKGVCSVCQQVEFKQTAIDWAAKAVEFDSILDSVRGKYAYDCIVPFSGGKDSTFTLWHLVKKKKLKPLVVRFDHGFMRPTLLENNHRTFRTLGVDVLSFTPNWQIVRKLMLEALRRRGDFCWHCHTGIFAYPMWIAVEKKVPLVIWGEPSSEYSSFYGYEEEEEVDERRFNTIANLGINAEDMLGMLDNSVSDYPVTARDLKPYTYPPLEELRQLRLRSVCLGSYIPWDVKEQVAIIKSELGWKGDEVEGVPPEYDYEKIECFMQGVRDYIKFLKRGFGRTTHLASIDIRNGRLTREEGEALVEQYDGRRPNSLELFLQYVDLTESEFMEAIRPHVVPPHQMPDLNWAGSHKMNHKPWDFEQWSSIVGDRSIDK